MLQVSGLSVEVGGRLTLADASFTLQPGDKVGLVGRNGAGKTSLLRVLGGESPPAAGTVVRKGALGYLPQDPRPRGAGMEATGLSHILSGRGLDEAAARLDKLRLALEEDGSERSIARFSRAEEAYFAADGYAAEANVRRLAAGLGLGADRIDLPITALSGGERRRVELARILFAGSDVLLLDEPTNHLDTDAKTWLMGFLRTYRGALLVVSHDLHLLDQAINRILHVDEGQLVTYRGTYSQYRKTRAEHEARARKVAERQKSEVRRLSELADAMRHQTARRARTARTLDRRVERLQESSVAGLRGPDAMTGLRGPNAMTGLRGPNARERTYRVRFPEPPRSGRVALEVSGLAKGYGGEPVFEGVDVVLERGRRLLVMGLNGAGKTTLLRILAGRTEPSSGTVRTGFGVSVGYYAQEHEGIEGGVSVLENVRAQSAAPDVELRSLLGAFGLVGDVAFREAGTLSGGEKTKLALAQLVAGRHNLLLLDEPTNNLDPPSRSAIGAALAAWPGTMVVVSHDTAFVRELAADDALVLPDAVLQRWTDDLLELVAMA